MSDILFSWNQRTAQRFYSAPFTRPSLIRILDFFAKICTAYELCYNVSYIIGASSQQLSPCTKEGRELYPAGQGTQRFAGTPTLQGLDSTNVRRIGVSRHYRNSTYERTDKLSVAAGDESHAFRQIFL